MTPRARSSAKPQQDLRDGMRELGGQAPSWRAIQVVNCGFGERCGVAYPVRGFPIATAKGFIVGGLANAAPLQRKETAARAVRAVVYPASLMGRQMPGASGCSSGQDTLGLGCRRRMSPPTMKCYGLPDRPSISYWHRLGKEAPANQRLKLTGAAMLVLRASTSLQAAPAA